MTISGALSNAMSGLRAAGRGAEVVSSNISNALTPGYARRELSLVSSSIGDFGGVRVNGVQRISDAGLASDLRLADAELQNAESAVNFFAQTERLLGTPDDPASIAAQLSAFESSLITASSRPDAPERLAAAVNGAKDLAQSITKASEGLQDMRSAADRKILAQVTELNAALTQVRTLNNQITVAQSQGRDSSSLLDQRQQTIGQISALVPVKQVPRDNGEIALYSTGGAILLDGTAVEIGFTLSNVVTAYQSISNATLSGLTLNGTPIRTDSESGILRGGALSAQFEVRDEYAVEVQSQLDALARDLVDRFQTPSVDPSLTPGDAGLFTDSGSAFNPSDEVGLSTRLRVNTAVDPNQGGKTWKLRDGINTIAPGNIGDAELLQRLTTALSERQAPASGSFGSGEFSFTSLTSNFAAEIGAELSNAERSQSYASTRFAELTEQQLADGVDTDAEIQRLLLVERSYAANARIIQTVEEMLEKLTRI
jgi:flagellar hook-associated protein 1 FlgK